MKNIIYILLLPALIYAQDTTIVSNIKSKNLNLSFQCGMKIYSGNVLLDHRKFSREGFFGAFNFFTEKEITNKVNIISQASFSLSNAIAKEINISIPETGIEFVTKIPNILAGNLNYKITINRKINNFANHGFSLKFRVFPLFYKKGQVFNNQLHSLGGFISSEENGSLPDLEKAAQLSYSMNYLFNNSTSISIVVFANSDWTINNFNTDKLYPGITIQFEKILNQNFQPPWIRKFNK